MENKEMLIKQTRKLLETAKRVGLEINVETVEYMIGRCDRAIFLENVHACLEAEIQ